MPFPDRSRQREDSPLAGVAWRSTYKLGIDRPQTRDAGPLLDTLLGLTLLADGPDEHPDLVDRRHRILAEVVSLLTRLLPVLSPAEASTAMNEMRRSCLHRLLQLGLMPEPPSPFTDAFFAAALLTLAATRDETCRPLAATLRADAASVRVRAAAEECLRALNTAPS
jgi:hypothetical protein